MTPSGHLIPCPPHLLQPLEQCAYIDEGHLHWFPAKPGRAGRVPAIGKLDGKRIDDLAWLELVLKRERLD
jgi:hypothetical protein